MGFNFHFRVVYLDFHLIGECYDEGQKAVSQQERCGHFS